MIEIKHATEINEAEARRRISEIFVDGFGQYFTYFSKDKTKLAKAFEHMFDLSVFYVAIVDGEIAGIAACTDGKTFSVKHNGHEFRKYFGWFKGTIADFALKSEFQKPPIEVREKLASVEFVATDSLYRGKGVATALLKDFFTFPQYKEYILEVADTNTNAVKLYEKLGFKEFTRKKQFWSKISGVNFLVYMKYKKLQK